MRQLFLHILLMAITFSLGLGVDWLRPKAKVNNARPVEPVEIVLPKVIETQAAPPVTAGTPAAHLIFDYNPKRFTPDGVYLINGATPLDFREFHTLNLSWSEFQGQSSAYVGLQTYSDNVYRSPPVIFALVTERRLFFATSSDANGIEYRFDGEFVADPKSHIDTNVTVLRGVLTKSRNGRKIAERQLNFRLEFLGC